jgi:hypothetical protein
VGDWRGEEEGGWQAEKPSMIQQAFFLKNKVTLRELLSKVVDDSVLDQIDTGRLAVDEKGQFVTRREDDSNRSPNERDDAG